MKYIFVIMMLVASPAFADEFNAGYERGYNTGVDAPNSASEEYKYGAREGAYDSDEDDRIEQRQSQTGNY